MVNMGDRIAQLIFEKIKTPKIKEVEELGESGRGEHGYGSTGVSAGKTNENQAIKTNDEGSSQRSVSVQAVETNLIDKVAKRQSPSVRGEANHFCSPNSKIS